MQNLAANLNKDKWLIIRISCRRESSVPTYSLDGVPLVPVDSWKYLFILITSDLRWNDHLSKIVGLASHRLCLVQRVFRNNPKTVKETGYTTLVCPLLEYCSPVWNPHLVTQILAVEMVQHRAVRFVKDNFQWTSSVAEMLGSLHWDTLRSRWENWSLELYKRFNLTCNSNLIANIFRANLRAQRCHPHSKPLIEIHAKQDCYNWSFFLH